MEKTITILEKDYNEFIENTALLRQTQKENVALKAQIDYLTQLLKLRVIDKFAQKSETYEQLSLFDDVELNKEIEELEQKINEEESQKVAGYVRTKKKNLVNEDLNLPVSVVEVTMDDPDLIDINEDKVVRELMYEPPKFYIRETRYHVYKKKLPDGSSTLVSKDKAVRPFGKSMISSELVSKIIYDKVYLSLPLYRQEKDLALQGINLSRQDMSNLVYKAADILKPISERIDQVVNESSITRSDETTLKVIKVADKDLKVKTTKTKSYVWVYSTGFGETPATSYKLGPTRSRTSLLSFLDSSKPRFLHCDGYTSYRNVPNLTIVPCFTHMRREFANILKVKTCNSQSEATIVVKAFDSIFHTDNIIRKKYKNDFEKIKEERLKLMKPLVDDLFKLLNDYASKGLKKSLFMKAVNYSLNLEKDAYNIFLDGRLELSNNASERKVKDFVIGRKNWLFSNTSKGAEVTCLLYSVVRTAVDNNLDPFKYLNYIFNTIGTYTNPKEFNIDDYVPWSEKLPQEIRLD